MKSPIELLSSLLADARRFDPDVKGLERDLYYLSSRYEDEGFGFLTKALPALSNSLDKGLESRHFACPIGFKKAHRGTIPAFLQGMFSKVFDYSSGTLLENYCQDSLESLKQILVFWKKCLLSDEDQVKLDLKAKKGFSNDDAITRSISIDPRDYHLIGRISTFILNDLHSVDYSGLWYKHGPGAVCEGYKSNQKWSALDTIIRNDDSFAYDIGADLFSTSQRFHMESNRSEGEDFNIACEPTPDGAISGVAKLISVPKNSVSRRTITIEPLKNQFAQQGYNIACRDSILTCKILSRCLQLSDQSLNQILALNGSITNEWSTIDLKSASDLLSIPLVKAVFQNHSTFVERLLRHRSSHYFVQDSPVEILSKFAGMGNATTFPVQSVVFAVIAITAILESWGNRPNMETLKRAADHIQVYGDDIIVRTCYARQVVTWLERVGLKVNLNKSFIEGNFKESCGVEAFNGVDVTPLYIKHRPDVTSLQPDAIAGFVSLSNTLWMKGYYTTSELLRRLVESELGSELPLVSSRSSALGWVTRNEAFSFQKWNRKLHRFEIRAHVQISPTRKDSIDGYPALLKYFLTPLLGRMGDHLNKSEVRFKSRIVRRWVHAT